jgi:hypothetical protein
VAFFVKKGFPARTTPPERKRTMVNMSTNSENNAKKKAKK